MTGAPIFDPETGEVVEAGGAAAAAPVMSLDDARALLMHAHGVAVGRDDPVLMLLTLHQGFLRDYEALLSRHDQAISALLGATGKACADAVESVLSSLKDKTVKASLDQAFALVERQAAAMERLRVALLRHRLIHGGLTALSLLACGLSLSILVFIIR